jgi:hypothetical protein
MIDSQLSHLCSFSLLFFVLHPLERAFEKLSKIKLCESSLTDLVVPLQQQQQQQFAVSVFHFVVALS